MTDAVMAQVVEHVLGKDEVTSSNLVNSSKGFIASVMDPFAFPSKKIPVHMEFFLQRQDRRGIIL